MDRDVVGSKSKSLAFFFLNKMVKRFEFVTEEVSVSNVHEAPPDKVVKSGENGLFFRARRQRVYIDNPEEAPEEYEVQEGARGGLYYEMPADWVEEVPDGYDVAPFYGDMDNRTSWSVLQGQGFMADVEGEGMGTYDVVSVYGAANTLSVVIEDEDGNVITEEGSDNAKEFSPSQIDVEGRLKEALDENGRPVGMEEFSPPDVEGNLPDDFDSEMKEEVNVEFTTQKQPSEEIQNQAINYLEQYHDEASMEKFKISVSDWKAGGYQDEGVDEAWAAAMAMEGTTEPPSHLTSPTGELDEERVEDIDEDVMAVWQDMIKMSQEAIRETFGESVTVNRGFSEGVVKDYLQKNDDGSVTCKPQALESWSATPDGASPHSGRTAVSATMEFSPEDFAFFGPFALGSVNGTYKELTLGRTDEYTIPEGQLEDLGDFTKEDDKDNELYRTPIGESIYREPEEPEEDKQSKADPLTDDHQFYGDEDEGGDLYCENEEASFEMDEVGEDDECPWCGNPVSVFGRMDKGLDIYDHVKVWLRDPNKAPDNSTVIEASEPGPAGCTHYYFEFPETEDKADSYPEVPHKDSPPEVKEAVRRFKEEVPDDVKEDTPLLYWLLGTGTPEYKMSKEDADYKQEPEDDMVCSNCQYYYEGVDGEAVCSKVRGQVYPEHWCRLWAPADTQQEKEDEGTWEISTVDGIEGYQHSETGEFIPALNANTTMVADLSEKDEDDDSVDGWVPYVGPQGGHGWTNGEDVSYDEEPPGDTAIDQLSQEQKGDLRKKLLDQGMDEVDELLYNEGEAIPLEHRQKGETVILQKGGIGEYEINEIKTGGPGPDTAIVEDSFDIYAVSKDEFADKSVKIHSEPDGLSQFMPVSIEGWSPTGYDDEATSEVTLKDSMDGHIDLPSTGSFLTESEEHGMLVTQDTMKEDAEYVHPDVGEVTYTGEDESYGEYIMETEDGEGFIYDNSEDIMYQKVDVSPQEPSYDLEYLGAFDIDVIETTVDAIVENNPVGVESIETNRDIEAIAQFNYTNGKMEINPDNFDDREQLEKRFSKLQEDGFLTGEGDAQEHVLRHEVGHGMHAQMGLEDAEAKDMKYSRDEKEYVKENFGEYASTNPGELVAEVLSLLLDGVDVKEEYPKIYELYLEYQGPEQEEVNPI